MSRTLDQITTNRNRHDADRAAAAVLEQIDGAEAVCLFGSVARGDDNDASDIDLMVIGADVHMRRRSLRNAVPVDLSERVAVLYLTRQELESLFRRRPDFAAHIMIEGIVLVDRTGYFSGVMNGPIPPVTRANIDTALERLRLFNDLRRFNDNFLFCFARLYAIGKAVVILSLLHHGQAVFARRGAFTAWRRLNPELSDRANIVERLEPFYLLVRRGRRTELPFAHHGTSDKVTEAVAAIRAIGEA